MDPIDVNVLDATFKELAAWNHRVFGEGLKKSLGRTYAGLAQRWAKDGDAWVDEMALCQVLPICLQYGWHSGGVTFSLESMSAKTRRQLFAYLEKWGGSWRARPAARQQGQIHQHSRVTPQSR